MNPVTAGRGFTLLEALIAMAVISITLLAIGKNSRQQIQQAASLRQTTLASWVADNVVTETRLGLMPAVPGASKGIRHMGHQDWDWILNTQPSPGPNILRLDVNVRSTHQGAATIHLHTGFVRADLK